MNLKIQDNFLVFESHLVNDILTSVHLDPKMNHQCCSLAKQCKSECELGTTLTY